MIASRPLRVRCGIGLPHCLQKAVAELLACGRSKRVTDPLPRSQRTADAFDHLAGMGGPGRFPTARAVAIQEAVKGAISKVRRLASDRTNGAGRNRAVTLAPLVTSLGGLSSVDCRTERTR
jgi:hypothetical protein